MYTIKELAEKTGIIPNAIRFYEKKGLLCPKRTESNYRVYSAEDVTHLEMILLYRKMGFSIEDIRGLLAKNSSPIDQFVTQYTLLNQHIHSMVRIRETLGNCIEKLLNDDATDKDVDEEMLEQITETARLISLSENWRDEWNFDGQATRYDTFIREPGSGLAFYENYDLVLEKTAKQVQGGTVAEVGIGTGNLAKVILERSNEIEQYIGIDQSVNMLKEAKKKCPGVKLLKGDFLNLPLEAKSCDTIATSYAFHHCDEQEKKLAVEEMNRVLKSAGVIVIADLMFENQKARERFAANCSESEREDLEDEYFGNVDDVSAIFKKMGYSCKAEQVDELIWVLTARKQ